MSSIRYRPAIDGLRALAILSVFVFHLNKKWLPGGFVGVDVFFVISGFLITSIIASECTAETFSIGRFYQRRIARIFPAFFAVAFVTLVGAAWIYSPQDYASAGANLAAAALSVSNMKSMLQGNYFEVSEDALPYLHYWSLSVEEQFYLIYPLLLMGIFKWAPRRVFAILSVIGIASFFLCIAMTLKKPVWAFFLLPTRAWELLSGCLLAVVLNRGSFLKIRLSRWVPIVGGLLVLLSFVVVPEGKSFPGAWALLPVIGSLGILAGNESGNWVEKLLSSSILVKVGKISYSLYLWHWPVFSFVDYKLILEDEWVRVGLKVSISLGAALVSYFFIERPFRNLLNERRRSGLAFGGIAVTAAVSIWLGIHIRNENYVNAAASQVAQGGLIFSPEEATQAVLLIGDSNGSMYGKTLKAIAEDHGTRFVLASVAGEDPLPAQSPGGNETLWKDSLEVARRERPSVIVLVCRWDLKLENGSERLETAIRELSPLTDKIIIFTQPPVLPPMATRENLREGGQEPFYEEEQRRLKRRQANDLIMGMRTGKVAVVDIGNFFEKEDGSIRFLDADGRQLYHDATHLSGFGAAVVIPEIEKCVRSALGTSLVR